ncbi:MaoC family dehydratase [Budvicia aquatica]|uniref:MaoC family dehydratase n=1 Tax=Budvicia aquatica TaxID=82979 RepID=UPI0020845E94|nr:MaoC family dehydratase [Budvicia aquatica]GKX51180.1 (R)-specific enoyl-CoA hydratase [Budvicia aquatica]
MLVQTIKFEDIEVGMSISYSQTITDADVKTFAGLSGDHNPVHVDEEYAAASRFKKRIAHGLISGSFFSALFGTKLPGPGCVYVAQSFQFKKPVYLGDTVKAIAEVTGIDKDKRRVFFRTFCKVGHRTVIDGQAELYVPEI